jgi:hypothetical protein
MSLKDELRSIDSEQLIRIAEAVQDKLKLPQVDLDAMLEGTFDDFPAFTDLTAYLMGKYENNTALTYKEKRAAVIGATTVLVILREYVKVQDMQDQFPDIPE